VTLGSQQSGLSSESVGSQLPVIPSQDEARDEEPPSSAEPRADRQESVSSGRTEANGDSRPASFEEAGGAGSAGTRKVAVSVHDERAQLLPSYSLKSSGSEPTETLLGRQDAGMRSENSHAQDGTVTKSTSGDTQASLGVSSNAEANAAVLGASTSSLTSIASSATYRQPPARHRRFAASCIDENDLSTPYNHYRCLSPNEHHHGTCALASPEIPRQRLPLLECLRNPRLKIGGFRCRV
jgi:hypothetical protein